jgi:TonB family protein
MKILVTITCLLATACCFAQRQNVYFLKNNGKYVDVKDSADFIRVVREPDSASTLYNVFEFYPDQKPKLVGKSTKIDPPRYEGQCIEFYHNGRKRKIITYKDGFIVGEEYSFFPNGKPYLVVGYPETGSYYDHVNGNYLIKANYDSVGTALVENGNGYYKGYDDKFTYVDEEGAVKNGKKDGQWKGDFKDSKITFNETYKDGVLIKGSATFKDGTTTEYFKSREVTPRFKGGLTGFDEYLTMHTVYPDYARANDIQGIVMISFVCEKDGSLTDVKVAKSVSPSLDAEAVRVIKNCPKWIPGTQFGRVVRVSYSVPINFALSN